MKMQIRKSCFETNSSSCHSICVTKNDIHVSLKELNEIYPERIYIYEGTLIIWNEDELEFGRAPFQILSCFLDKLKYVIAEYCGEYDRDNRFEEIFNIVKEIIPDIKEIKLPTQYKQVYIDEDGNKIFGVNVHTDYSCVNENDEHPCYYIKNGEKITVKESEFSYEQPYYGYVDHQSLGIVENFLKDNNITLKEFLTNKKYIIIIDGDEYNGWGNLKYAGVLNLNNIVSEYSDTKEERAFRKKCEQCADLTILI